MSSFAPPLPAEAAAAASSSVYVGGLPVAALLLLIILVVAKQTIVNVAGSRYERLSRCLDVGVAPIAATALAISAYEVARILG